MIKSRQTRNNPNRLKYIYWCGKTFYQFTAIDKFTRIGFAKVYSTKSSRNGKRFLQELEIFLPFKIEKIQTDNGSEFLGEFEEYLREKRKRDRALF